MFFDDLKITHHHSPIVQAADYYPFGLTFNSYQRTNSAEQRYLYNGIERQTELELGWDLAEFRSYMPELGRFMQIDPVIKFHESPYAWNTNNPILYSDPTGADSTQRANALAKAQEYVDKNPGNSYEWEAKGGPGENVDCSGMTSGCIVAGGESNPVNEANYSKAMDKFGKDGGVRRTIAGSVAITDNKELVPGMLVSFDNSKNQDNPNSHIGIIKDISVDSEGNITELTFYDSGCKQGPRVSTAISGGSNQYWGNRINGFYKWDTTPDKSPSPVSPVSNQTYISQGKDPSMIDRMINSGVPIIRDIGKIISLF